MVRIAYLAAYAYAWLKAKSNKIFMCLMAFAFGFMFIVFTIKFVEVNHEMKVKDAERREVETLENRLKALELKAKIAELEKTEK